MDRRVFLGTVGAAAVLPATGWAQDAAPAWVKLPTEPYRGKQDDISFVDAMTGWYGNGAGKLFRTTDGGETWTSEDMTAHTAMILDIHFVSEQVGFIAGASDGDVQVSKAVILRTGDGGRSWTRVYEGTRPWELTWKMAWPSSQVGYVTVQSYNPDPAASQRFVAKTTDGGLTWTEHPFVDNAAVREFGVGFISETRGWVGAVPGGYETTDGGASWSPVAMGMAVNKVRIVPLPSGGHAVFAIGVELHRLDLPA